jgi:ubiquitin-activating enzyme E1 C
MMSERWTDLDKLLLRSSPLAPPEFEAGEDIKDLLMKYARVLVVGAGGLGCEILKNLALSGFSDIHVIDLDRIDVTNLNRQFLFRQSDVGQYKADVAARFIMQRIPTCKVTSHSQPIQDFDPDFYRDFHIIVAGLDNIEARRWLNSQVHSLAEFDENGELRPETMKPLIDGGTEGFRGQARVILPYKTACFECTLGDIPRQVAFQTCTIAETPRIPEHCIQYAYIIEWPKHFDRKMDKDSAEDMRWVYEKAKERADLFGIEGVNYMKTMGVVKNIIPAIASTNALIAAACVSEALKIATYISKPLDSYFMFMGQTGTHTHTFHYERNEDCLVCSRKPVDYPLSPSKTLNEFISELCDPSGKYKMKSPAVSSSHGPLYIPRPAALEQKHRFKLSKSFEELINEGYYTRNEPLVITDGTFQGALTFNLRLNE